MRLPSDVKKCVVFIGLQMADSSMKIVGTGVLILDDISANRVEYIVTAKHIIEGIYGKGLQEVYIRVNLKDGTSDWITTQFRDWKLNSDYNVDVGIYQIKYNHSWDHIYYPLSTSLSDAIISSAEIGIGDEVFIVGLFTHHHGHLRNIPIARIGNISAMKEEKIQTSQHLMDGYLIEARSIGGLSGSPVFINLGEVRFLNGSLQHSVTGRAFHLMGLIYGHYDINFSNIDELSLDDNRESRIERVNTGIAIVTPVEKILDTILQSSIR